MSVFPEFTVSVRYLGFFASPYVIFPFSSQIIALKVIHSLYQVAVFVFSSIHIQRLLLFSSLWYLFLARSHDCYWLFVVVSDYRPVHFLFRFGSSFYRLFLCKANNHCCRFFSPNLLLVIVSSLVSQFFCNGHLVLFTSNGYPCRQFSSCPMRGPVFLSILVEVAVVVPSVLHTDGRLPCHTDWLLLSSLLRFGGTEGLLLVRTYRIVNSQYNRRCPRQSEGCSWSFLLHGME